MVANMPELDPSILIVDPHDAIRKLLIAQCRELGLIAHGVSSANQATRVLALASYDVLLVEQDLPEMNGQEFIRCAHEICSFPPQLCILMRDDVRSDQATDGYCLATVFLRKPIHTQTLAEAIFTRLPTDLDAAVSSLGVKTDDGELSYPSPPKRSSPARAERRD